MADANMWKKNAYLIFIAEIVQSVLRLKNDLICSNMENGQLM